MAELKSIYMQLRQRKGEKGFLVIELQADVEGTQNFRRRVNGT